MLKRILILGGALICASPLVSAEVAGEENERQVFSDNFSTLGTEQSRYGGDDFTSFDRNQIQHQIKSFIPPLLRPAFTQHAFVLPPNAATVSLSQRYMNIKGDDFFMNGEPNTKVFGDFEVDRQLTDLDLFYGFDFGKKYLHGFTARVNIPYLSSQTNGSINPNGQQFIDLENSGSTQSLGDVSIFVKKKIFDQGTKPFGFAIVGGITLPTGKNDEKFGSNGRITARRPQPPNTTVAQGFDALQKENVSNGTWGDGRCFFGNFNTANPTLCNNNSPFNAPAAMVQSFAPGGANADNQFVGDFPFNNGVFGRFADDGRLPSTLQPGTGGPGYMLGMFLTRQFNPGSVVGRSAAHFGLTHNFVSEEDGIDYGDTTTVFASYVKPVFKDFLAVDLTFVGFDHEDDSYSGKIPEPEIHTCSAADVGAISNCSAAGDDVFLFDLHDRASFSGGFTGFVAPSLIYSPDPQIRMTLSALVRVIEPDLGPAPQNVIRGALEFTF